jgi:hypothetical protein
VLALIPFINFFFWVYASFAVVLYVLDWLNTGKSDAPHTHSHES